MTVYGLPNINNNIAKVTMFYFVEYEILIEMFIHIS